MDDALVVAVRQGIAQLERIRDRFIDGYGRPLVQVVTEQSTVDPLKCEVWHATARDLAGGDNTLHVRVIQQPRDLEFSVVSGARPSLLKQLQVRDLKDDAFALRATCLEDDAHAALSKATDELVDANLVARRVHHWPASYLDRVRAEEACAYRDEAWGLSASAFSRTGSRRVVPPSPLRRSLPLPRPP